MLGLRRITPYLPLTFVIATLVNKAILQTIFTTLPKLNLPRLNTKASPKTRCFNLTFSKLVFQFKNFSSNTRRALMGWLWRDAIAAN